MIEQHIDDMFFMKKGPIKEGRKGPIKHFLNVSIKMWNEDRKLETFSENVGQIVTYIPEYSNVRGLQDYL